MGIGRHFIADFARGSGHHAEHPGRHSRPLRQFAQRQGGQRCLRGGLDHHRTPRGQRRRHLAGDHGGRKIPWRDGDTDPYRLTKDDDPLVVLMLGNDLAIDPLCLLGEPFEEGCRIGNFTAGLAERLALLQGHQPCQIFLVLHHELKPAAQDLGAFLGQQSAPPRLRIPGMTNGFPCFRPTHFRDSGDHVSIGRVGHCKRFTAFGIPPGAIDVAPLTKKSRIGQLHDDLR